MSMNHELVGLAEDVAEGLKRWDPGLVAWNVLSDADHAWLRLEFDDRSAYRITVEYAPEYAEEVTR